jgi:hypothetical protein
MFPSTIFAVLALLFVSRTVASPSPIHMRMRRALSARMPEPLDTIPAYIKRASPSDYGKRAENPIPAEVATKSPAGAIELYTRDGLNLKRADNPIPAEVATKSPAGAIELYTRDGLNLKRADNPIPAEVATKSPAGAIELYTRDGLNLKRADNPIPAEVATKSPAGTVELY